MWFDADPEASRQDDPPYPVEAGDPLTAAISALIVLGMLAAAFLVTP